VSARLSVCLSVYLSVTRWQCVKTNERRVMRFSPTGKLWFFETILQTLSQRLLTLTQTLKILVWKKPHVSMRRCHLWLLRRDISAMHEGALLLSADQTLLMLSVPAKSVVRPANTDSIIGADTVRVCKWHKPSDRSQMRLPRTN